MGIGRSWKTRKTNATLRGRYFDSPQPEPENAEPQILMSPDGDGRKMDGKAHDSTSPNDDQTGTPGADDTVTVDVGPGGRAKDAGLADASSRLPATEIEGYEVEEVLASGGMGAVLLCRDRSLRRPVAVKVMQTGAADFDERRLRFIEEAQVTGQLEHPNIIPVHALGRDHEGKPFYSMKLVRGRSLREILDEIKEGGEGEGGGDPAGVDVGNSKTPRDLLPTRTELLNIFLKVCDGIGFAHSHGIIHRDLKPANIMVGGFGEVLVTDWGLAKILHSNKRPSGARPADGEPVSGVGQTEAGSSLVADSKGQPASIHSDRMEADGAKTRDGSISGTPAYMSPEQAAGQVEGLDRRSDVYSLGAILYEVLTLRRAFSGESITDLLGKVREGRMVPPHEIDPDRGIPPELSAITMKAMALDPEERYQTVGELSEDLLLFLGGRGVSAKEDTFFESLLKLVRRNQGVSGAVAIAAALLIAVSAGFMANLMKERDRARASELRAIEEMGAAELARKQQRETALSASSELAYQAIRAAEQGRWVEASIRSDAAMTMAPDGPWGHYAKGLICRERKELPQARVHLESACRAAPDGGEFRAALAQVLAIQGKASDASSLVSDLAEVESWRELISAADALYEANDFSLALRAYRAALGRMEQASDVPPHVPQHCQSRLAHAGAWASCEGFPEAIRGLEPDAIADRIRRKLAELHGVEIELSFESEAGAVTEIDFSRAPVKFLQPLRGLLLRRFDCSSTEVDDLGPLKGMPLTEIKCRKTGVSDLGPLRGMPLVHLDCNSTQVWSLAPLTRMRLTYLNCGQTRVRDLEPLDGMPIEVLNCSATEISDLAPLAGMPLKTLIVHGTGIKDLSPLKGLPLVVLSFQRTEVRSLEPLRGMPLEELRFGESHRISDLSPLEGMKLKELSLYRTQVSNLSPLSGMLLQKLHFAYTPVKDLSPLRGMPLRELVCYETAVSDLGPLGGAQLLKLWISGTPVRDLGPLEGVRLKDFYPPEKAQLTAHSLEIIEEMAKHGCRVVWK